MNNQFFHGSLLRLDLVAVESFAASSVVSADALSPKTKVGSSTKPSGLSMK